MNSLENNLVDSQVDLIHKRIVAMEIIDCYPMGYVIVDTGEFIAFVDDGDGLSLIGAKEVEKKLYYNNNLLTIFARNGCISKEYYDYIVEKREEYKKKNEIAQRERDYQRYLELKAIYDNQ